MASLTESEQVHVIILLYHNTVMNAAVAPLGIFIMSCKIN